MSIVLNPIGKFNSINWKFSVKINEEFKEGLKGLEEFSHLILIGYAHLNEKNDLNNKLVLDKPYTKGPEKIGLFATRSEFRPNSLIVSVVEVVGIDFEKGIVNIAYGDFEDGTPVFDIKPYHPVADRIKNVKTPEWCSHWPQYYEDSANFNWEKEFNF